MSGLPVERVRNVNGAFRGTQNEELIANYLQRYLCEGTTQLFSLGRWGGHIDPETQGCMCPGSRVWFHVLTYYNLKPY